MKVSLIGASGFVGSAILEELTQRGHHVNAIARDSAKIKKSDHVQPIAADVTDTDELQKAIADSDAVISAYNAGWTNPNLYTDFLEASKKIQQTVKESGIKRLIVVGGAGSLYSEPGKQIVDAADFPSEIKPGATAARDYLHILQNENDLEWTFLSPAIEMHPGTSGVRKGEYRTGLDQPVFDIQNRSVISVEDVAVAIVDELENPQHIKRRFTVAY